MAHVAAALAWSVGIVAVMALWSWLLAAAARKR